MNVLSNGAIGGICSPTIPLLLSEDTPLQSGPLTIDQISWIVSLISPGSMLGIIVYSWSMERFGRKLSGCCMAFPQILSWILIYLAKNEFYLYISRFLAGFVGGAMFTLIPIYINEISETRVRGLLGSLLVLFVNVGVFLGLLAGAYLDFQMLCLVFVPLSVGALIGFSFFPETPVYLSKTNRHLVSLNNF